MSDEHTGAADAAPGDDGSSDDRPRDALAAGEPDGARAEAELPEGVEAPSGGDGSADGREAQAGGGVPAFRVAFDRGVTVTKWTRVWEQRLPGIPLRVSPSETGQQTSALHEGAADVSFVRHPFVRDGLSAIELYAEKPVVGVARDHPASVFEVVDVADLADEHLLQGPDEVPEWRDVAAEIADGSRRPLLGIRTLDDAVEQVASGVGIVILPQSIARLHSRKDVVYRPVTGVADTPVSLVWREGDPSPLVEEFIGIVRGRSASSSRGAAASALGDGSGGALSGTGRTADARGTGRSGGAAGEPAPAKKLGPVAKAKAKARAAREAEERASGVKPGSKQVAPRKKTQSEQANKAQARRRKFGGKR